MGDSMGFLGGMRALLSFGTPRVARKSAAKIYEPLVDQVIENIGAENLRPGAKSAVMMAIPNLGIMGGITKEALTEAIKFSLRDYLIDGTRSRA